MSHPLSRPHALALVALLWAAIYLPALGTLELKGEEGRRIVPGITMLQTGNWIVPAVGGVPYFSKPPLVNWVIAAAIHLTGRQDEWVARTPSVLCALLLGLGTVWMLAEWLGAGGALLAAIFMLTGIGMMEKGRLAEIESLYISLSGLALVTWLGLWQRHVPAGAARPRAWAAWTVPWLFLGLGLLTKGPLHVVYFYAVVGGVLLAARRTRELVSWAHLAGIALMLGIFALWAVPYLQQTAAGRAGTVWTAQLTGRVEVTEQFRPVMWLLNMPRGLVNFLPWTVLLPLLWVRRPVGAAAAAVEPGAETDFAILRGGRWGLAACFAIVSLAPGGLPRYTLPLLVPASVLLALVGARQRELGAVPPWLPLAWTRTLRVCLGLALLGAVAATAAVIVGVAGPMTQRPEVSAGWHAVAGLALGAACVALLRQLRASAGGAGGPGLPWLALASAAVMAILTGEYAIAAVPRMQGKERLRPAAQSMRAIAGGHEFIYAYQPGFLPLFFYLQPQIRYTQAIADLPASARYLLVAAKNLGVVQEQLKGRGLTAELAFTMHDLSRGTWYLLRLNPS